MDSKAMIEAGVAPGRARRYASITSLASKAKASLLGALEVDRVVLTE